MTDLTSADVPLELHPDPARALDGLLHRLQHRRYAHEHRDAEGAARAAEALVARVGDRGRLLEVRLGSAAGGGAGSQAVGELWFVVNGDERSVVDLALDDAALAPAAREAAERLARAEGAVRLTVTVSADDAVAEAFVRGGGFEVAATQMALDLTGDLPPEDRVVLAPMDAAAWEVWWAQEEEGYIAERVVAGESPERAREVSEQQHAELLPHGRETEHHHFFVGQVDGETVGTLWLGTERPMAFVYDVVVDPAHRRRGYGAGLMRAGALWSRDHGAHELGLNVFGHNAGARALYDGLGYRVTEQFHAKPLA